MDDYSDASASGASEVSCAQKACASDCPLVGAVRIEPGDDLRQGVLYRKNYSDSTVVHCTAPNNPIIGDIAFVVPQGRQYWYITPRRSDFHITGIDEDVEVWFAPVSAPVRQSNFRSLEENSELRRGDIIGCRSNHSLLVLRSLDTGEELPFRHSSGDMHTVQTDSVVAFCTAGGYHRVVCGN